MQIIPNLTRSTSHYGLLAAAGSINPLCPHLQGLDLVKEPLVRLADIRREDRKKVHSKAEYRAQTTSSLARLKKCSVDP